MAVNICWDSVVKYLTDSVHWLSMLAEKNSHIWHVTDMVNADCVLDALCPVLVMFGARSWSYYEWRIVCLWPGDNFDVFCMFARKDTHNI